MPATKVSFNDKQDYIDNPTIPDEQKIKAENMNEVKKAVNDNAKILDEHTVELDKKTSITIDDVVQENLTMSSTRDTIKDFETFVELKDSNGKKVSVAVSPKNIYMKSGATEVTLEQIVNGVNFDCGETDSAYLLGTFAEWIAYRNTLNLEEN